jgi:hypothetical protein
MSISPATEKDELGISTLNKRSQCQAVLLRSPVMRSTVPQCSQHAKLNYLSSSAGTFWNSDPLLKYDRTTHRPLVLCLNFKDKKAVHFGHLCRDTQSSPAPQVVTTLSAAVSLASSSWRVITNISWWITYLRLAKQIHNDEVIIRGKRTDSTHNAPYT